MSERERGHDRSTLIVLCLLAMESDPSESFFEIVQAKKTLPKLTLKQKVIGFGISAGLAALFALLVSFWDFLLYAYLCVCVAYTSIYICVCYIGAKL